MRSSAVMAFCIRALKETWRIKTAFFFNILWPSLWYFMIIYVTAPLSKLPDPTAIPYAKANVAISMIVFGFVTTGLASVASFVAADRERGVYRKFLSTPLRSSEELLGRTLGALSVNGIVTVLISTIAFLDGARLNFQNYLALPFSMLIMVFITLFCFGVGYIIASFTKRVETATVAGTASTVIIGFLTGIFIPKEQLPNILKPLSNYFPPSAGINIISKSLLWQHPLNELLIPFAYVAISSIGTYFLGTMIFTYWIAWKRAEYR